MKTIETKPDKAESKLAKTRAFLKTKYWLPVIGLIVGFALASGYNVIQSFQEDLLLTKYDRYFNYDNVTFTIASFLLFTALPLSISFIWVYSIFESPRKRIYVSSMIIFVLLMSYCISAIPSSSNSLTLWLKQQYGVTVIKEASFQRPFEIKTRTGAKIEIQLSYVDGKGYTILRSKDKMEIKLIN